MRYFLGLSKLSVKNHPLRSTAVPFGLYSSMASVSGGSVWVRISLINTACTFAGGGSITPGEPPSRVLGLQLVFWFQVFQGASSLTITSEAPAPSVIGYHLLS